jgi:hypothetical protein
MNTWQLALPGLGVVASLTYLFGFFGVSLISSVVTEEWDASEATQANSVKQVPRQPEVCHTTASRTHVTTPPPQVIVVGGGVAGCTSAIALAKQGYRVTLIERDLSEQDRIVGELLQPGGVRALERLGISDCLEKSLIDSVRVDGYVVFDPAVGTTPSREIVLKYPVSDPAQLVEYFGVLPKDDNGSEVRQTLRDPENIQLQYVCVAHCTAEVSYMSTRFCFTVPVTRSATLINIVTDLAEEVSTTGALCRACAPSVWRTQ